MKKKITPKQYAIKMVDDFRGTQPKIMIDCGVDASYELATNGALISINRTISSVDNLNSYVDADDVSMNYFKTELKFLKDVRKELKKLL